MRKIVPYVFLGMFGLSCGGDEPPEPKPAAARSSAKKSAPKKKKQTKGTQTAGYEKIPDDLRRKFTQRDFDADSSGDERRDPFRSLFFNASLEDDTACLLYTSPSPRDATLSRMPSSA